MTKYIAQFNEGGRTVVQVHCVHDNLAPTEAKGIEFLNKLFKKDNVEFKQTFKDRSQRAHFASKGHTYDDDNDVFIPEKPYPSWTLNTEIWNWEAPVAHPLADDPTKLGAETYYWDEPSTSWKKQQKFSTKKG